MPVVRRKFVDGIYGQVHVRIVTPDTPESRPPLICLHQSPKSSREFLKILPYLAKDRFVIAIDSPGHGESDLPPSMEEATIPNYARSAWSVLDAMNLSHVDILGHHTGAKVATEMTFQRPDDVRQVLMISALVLTAEEQAGFADMFEPVPLDEAGTRFSSMWARAIEYRGPGVSLEDMAESYAENLRAGEAYEWGHQAAFAYNEFFADRVKTLPHRISVFNPQDMLYDLTPRVVPYLQNGELIDKPEWEFGFMDVNPEGAAAAFLNALDRS